MNFTYTAVEGGSREYSVRKTGFTAAYYTKKEIEDMYPAGGYSVVAQIGKGRTKQGELLSGEASEPIYAVSKLPHSKIKGYIPVGEREYVVIVKDVLLLWLLFSLLALLAVAALVFLIIKVVPANGGAPETTKAPGVVDSNAQEGEGEWDVPEKIDTAGRNIKIFGITDLKLKAGTVDQNFVLSNPKENPCYFKYEIVLLKDNKTEEIIYTSDLVPPGYSISKFKLNRALDAGSYRAVIHVKTFTFDKQQRPLNNFDMKTSVTVSE